MSATQTRSFTILLVEDSPVQQALTRRALEDSTLHADLHVVEDGVAALQYLKGEGEFRGANPRPDIVLLDLNMPRMGGHEFLDKLKADPKFSQIPVTVLTTSNADSDATASYAIRTESAEFHWITLHATLDSTPYRRLDVMLGTDAAGGSPVFISASYATVSGTDVAIWDSSDEAALELTSTGAHSHRGSLRVPMHTSGATGPVELALELEFTTEKWRWPPDLVCAVGHD